MPDPLRMRGGTLKDGQRAPCSGTREILNKCTKRAVLSVSLFGPEGGFEKEEMELAMGMGAQPVRAGKRILRTETAGLCILSVLMFLLEE